MLDDNNKEHKNYSISHFFHNDIVIKSRQKSKKNSTHDRMVDLNIKNASLWKINKYKHIFEIFLYFLSLRIIHLIQEFIFPN